MTEKSLDESIGIAIMNAMRRSTQGRRLKAWREKAGLTQKQVAERLGVQQGTYAAYELDMRSPRVDIAARIDRMTDGTVSVFGWAA
jgi:DNA-binding XRE family transcriptional regulator